MTDIIAYEQQARALAGSAALARQILAEIEPALGALYNGGDATAQGHVMVTWERAQALAGRVEALDAALAAGGAAIEELVHQRDAITEELEELVEAISGADERNPHIAKMIDGIREDAYEVAAQDASDYAYESWYNDMFEVIRRDCGPDGVYKRVDLLIEYLSEELDPTPEADALLAQFVQQIQADQEARRVQR